MRAEIIAVGTELLLGQIVNTNAAFLSQELAGLGINVYHHVVVGDNPERLERVLQEAESRSELIILSGGLGPTKDDLTKQTVANHLKRQLVTDTTTLEKVIAFHEHSNRPMAENNKLQAVVLEGSIVLKNSTGLAAGMFLQNEKTIYVLLPGPPNELKPMFLHEVKPLLLANMDKPELLISRVLRFFGIGESRLVTILDDLIEKQTNPTLAPYAGVHEVTLRISANGATEEACIQLLNTMEAEIQKRVGSYFYGYGDETNLVESVVNLLKEHHLTITAAESLTGGEFQSSLASVSGVSEVFNGGVVTYSNESKSKLLNVSEKTIAEAGVVSEACGIEMAEGVRKLFNTDIALSFTGVAGPNSLEGQAVGTVWIGIAQKGKPSFAKCYHFARNRNSNRQQATLSGLDLVRRLIKQLPLDE
ncbi:competence/damage-inducible protein A [Carnobacterium gallinarum]|uniref:competence/damage-inducible protein A n=1 Tax=Carnobacterium gallinarum TaxID=2749 RepID=UPI00054F7CCE|nr:competence/damage-inducible protein A [Carnobacterium gallinarum]